MSAGAARAARRIVPIDVELLLASGVAFSAVVRDLSTTGVFIVTERLLDIGAIVSLELHLPGADLLVQSRHRVSATVVRRAESGYGLVLLEPSSELVAAITVVAVR